MSVFRGERERGLFLCFSLFFTFVFVAVLKECGKTMSLDELLHAAERGERDIVERMLDEEEGLEVDSKNSV